MSEIPKLVQFDTKFNNEGHLAIFSEINVDSSSIDVILLTNLIFPASKFEVPILNIEWSFLQAHDFNEMSKNH